MMIYILQASVCLTIFYVVYVLLFQRSTSFRFNRIYLMLTLLFSAIIPLLEFETYNETVSAVSSNISNTIVARYAAESPSFSFNDSILALYFGGLVISLLVLCFRLFRLYKIVRKGTKINETTYPIIQSNQDIGVCSFLKFIIVPKGYTPNSFEMTHEKSHIDQYHSIDIIIARLYQIIFWFNPIAYLYSFKLAEVHEFLADQSTIRKLGKSDYQNHLLQVLSQRLQPQLVHNFNSIIKTRLTMMNSQTKPKVWSYFVAIAAICSTIALFSCHSKKAVFYTMSENGPIRVELETVTDTLITIDYDTYEETVTYIEREMYFVTDTTIVIDYDTMEEMVTIVKTYLEPQDLIKK